MKDLLENIKLAITAAVATTGTGLATALEVIPDDIGKLASIVGIFLTSVLIYTHWRKGRIEYKKTQLEITILQDQIARNNHHF